MPADGDEHPIRLGNMRLAGKQNPGSEQGRTKKSSSPSDQRNSRPEQSTCRQSAANKGGQPIAPDLLGFGRGESGCGCGLQPVNACRLLVAEFVLIADRDIIAGLKILF